MSKRDGIGPEQERTVVRAMVSDAEDRSRIITVEEVPGDEIVSVVVADGSGDIAKVVALALDASTAREIGEALIEAADGLDREEARHGR